MSNHLCELSFLAAVPACVLPACSHAEGVALVAAANWDPEKHLLKDLDRPLVLTMNFP